MPTPTPLEEVAALIRQLDDAAYRSLELAGELRNMVKNDYSDDAYVLREVADHVTSTYRQVKELKKLLPAIQ